MSKPPILLDPNWLPTPEGFAQLPEALQRYIEDQRTNLTEACDVLRATQGL